MKRSLLILCIALPCRGDYIGEITVDAVSEPVRPVEKKKSAPENRSELWIYAGTRATIVLTDEKGRRTGRHPQTGQIWQEIPGSRCEIQYIENEITGDSREEADQRISLQRPLKGVYRIQATGLQNGPYRITITGQAVNGVSIPTTEAGGIISQDEVESWMLVFDPAPNALPRLVSEKG